MMGTRSPQDKLFAADVYRHGVKRPACLQDASLVRQICEERAATHRNHSALEGVIGSTHNRGDDDIVFMSSPRPASPLNNPH